MNMDDPVMQAMHSKCAKQMALKNKSTKGTGTKDAGHEGMNHAEMDHSKMPINDGKMHMPESSAEHKHN